MDMTAIIDRSVLDEIRALGGPGDDLLSEVIGVFLAEGPGQVRSVNEALASRDAAAIQRAAHRLKGSALGLGARRLAALVAAVELAARAGDVERAISVAAGLGAAGDAARAARAPHRHPESLIANPESRIPYPDSLILNPSSRIRGFGISDQG